MPKKLRLRSITRALGGHFRRRKQIANGIVLLSKFLPLDLNQCNLFFRTQGSFAARPRLGRLKRRALIDYKSRLAFALEIQSPRLPVIDDLNDAALIIN